MPAATDVALHMPWRRPTESPPAEGPPGDQDTDIEAAPGVVWKCALEVPTRVQIDKRRPVRTHFSKLGSNFCCIYFRSKFWELNIAQLLKIAHPTLSAHSQNIPDNLFNYICWWIIHRFVFFFFLSFNHSFYRDAQTGTNTGYVFFLSLGITAL